MSAAFRDSQNRQWVLALDAPTIRKIKEILGINLADIKSDPIAALESDPVTLVDVLWLAVEDKAAAIGVTDIAFGKSLSDGDGAIIGAATEALAEAILNFFPPGKRSHLRSLFEKNREIQTKAADLALARLSNQTEKLATAVADQISTEMDRTISDLGSGVQRPGVDVP